MATTTTKTASTGAAKRAAATAKAERAAKRAAAAKAAHFADLFRTDYLVRYTTASGEARVRECRDEQGADFERRDLEAHGFADVRVECVRGKAAV